MKTKKEIDYKKLTIILAIPVIFFTQYYLFKFGIIKPMVKGIEIQMVDGDYVKDIDKFVMKLNDTVTLSSGDYITIPEYSKKPEIGFKVLDDGGVLEIKDKNKLISLKEGYSSVGIMKDSRILKKINIMVIEPKVQELKVELDKKLNYVGDIANIQSEVEVDYNRFKTDKEITYESTNENVLKIVDNKVEAVGVGKANLVVISGDKKEVFSYNVVAKIADIVLPETIDMQVGDNRKLEPKVVTSPRYLKHGKVTYELADRKLDVERAATIDKNGNITAIREGKERIKVICQNKTKIVTVNVSKKPINEEKVENLKVTYDTLDNKLQITLTWDHIKDVEEYEIYMKDNLKEEKFSLYHEIKVTDLNILENNKVQIKIEREISPNEKLDLSLYVVGKKNDIYTKPSEMMSIKLDENIGELQVEGLEYIVDEKDTINLKWKALNIPNVTYSIYLKDNSNEEDGFKLYEGEIAENKAQLKIDSETYDYDVYIKANKNGIYSKESNIINIKKQ